MKCKQCNIKVESQGTKPKLFCSDACRKKWTRNAAKRMEQTDTRNSKRTEETDKLGTRRINDQGVPEVYVRAAEDITAHKVPACQPDTLEQIAPNAVPIESPSYNDYVIDQESGTGRYVTRINPASLNWGEYMTAAELDQSGFRCNRVPIPGDWDYKGCCELINGQWQVRQVV